MRGAAGTTAVGGVVDSPAVAPPQAIAEVMASIGNSEEACVMGPTMGPATLRENGPC
jgi:hypothetical protein